MPLVGIKTWISFLILQQFADLVRATKKASCNGWTLTSPAEGSFMCNPIGVTISMPGTRCTLYCETGYRAKHEVVVCSETGGWVPTNSPECEVDSNMTLVIVLAIVGSIIVIFALSLLYARQSKRCRGKRRKLEDDDLESANKRPEIQDTSTYYGQVKRMRRKRRLQAERQRKVTEQKRRKDGTVDKTVTKQPTSRQKKDTKKLTKPPPKDTDKEKALKRTKERRKVLRRGAPKRKPPARGRKAAPRKKAVPKRNTPPRQEQKNKTLQDRLNEIFCFLCASKETRSTRTKKKNDTKVFSVSKNTAPAVKKRVIPSSSSSTSSSASSSSSSSSSESSSDEEKAPPKKEAKREDSAKTPAARAVKRAPKIPPPPVKKKPPPRPPAPIMPNRANKTSSETFASSDSRCEEATNRKAISSGYSSEGDRHKRKRGHSDSAAPRNSTKDTTLRPQSATGATSTKWMEVMTPGPETVDKETGNPYEHYPAALSYRQYQNFENDYRRTTGDYHPQYSIVELIPLESVKKPVEDDKKDEKESKDAKKPVRSAPGGVKYISISEEEAEDEDSDYEEPKSKRNRGKLAERYEDPSARDQRRRSPDYHRKHRTKRTKKDKKSKHETQAKKDRKREIEQEAIIDAGTAKHAGPVNRGESKKSAKSAKNEEGRVEKSKHKKRPK